MCNSTVLEKRDEGRGKNVFYSLSKDAKIRYKLNLPVMKDEITIEKGYRLLLFYIVFYQNQNRKFKDKNEYNALLEKLHINKKDPVFSSRLGGN